MNCEKHDEGPSVTFLASLASTDITFAQTKPATPATSSSPAIQMKTEAEGQAMVLTGKVRSVDAKAGKLTIKTKDREVKLSY